MKEKFSKKHILKLLRYFLTVLSFLSPILIFYITESMTHDIEKYMNHNAQVLNILLYELVFLLLFALTGSLKTALITETIFFTIYALANYYVISFRSTPIQPWDFFSIKTATSVASNFSYTLPAKILVRLAILIVLIVLFCFLKLKLPIKRFYVLRIILLVAAILSLGNFTNKLQDERFIAKMQLYDKLFTPTTIFYKDGGAVAFIMELKYMSVEVPKDYNKETAKELLKAQDEEILEDTSLQDTTHGKKPNVIVIMNEAFSDLSILGDFDTNEDYMPFIHSLQNSSYATTGNLNVSVVGGNTANTEFEFLTGNTTAFLPAGSVAYQQYLKQPIDCLPNYFNQLGYRTIAMHPYRASGWSRDTVYDYMTFDEKYFISDFSRATKVRDYVSDLYCTEKIIHTYEDLQKNSSDEPLFLFLVTMQNHSSYTTPFDNFTPNITVEGSKHYGLSAYLSLLQKSDAAFKQLIAYFSNVDEDTVIVFFGDHQPADSIANVIYQLNHINKSQLTDEELALRYKVPFVIWSNFPQEAKHQVETSANYLGLQALKIAGLPLTSYWKFLDHTQEEFPIISSQVIYDAAGNLTSIKNASPALYDYRCLQYYQLFDAINE